MVMLVWFGFINMTLAAFNMIPGFPLDGGRVLRAIVWWRTGNQVRATRVAATLGQIVAVGFIMFGFLSGPWRPSLFLQGLRPRCSGVGVGSDDPSRPGEGARHAHARPRRVDGTLREKTLIGSGPEKCHYSEHCIHRELKLRR
jgi:Peptidase family M50